MAIAGNATRAAQVQVMGNEAVATWGTVLRSMCYEVPAAMKRLERGESVWVAAVNIPLLREKLALEEVKL
jgi:hypothetical protein